MGRHLACEASTLSAPVAMQRPTRVELQGYITAFHSTRVDSAKL